MGLTLTVIARTDLGLSLYYSGIRVGILMDSLPILSQSLLPVCARNAVQQVNQMVF